MSACTQCGHLLDPADRFCGDCGAPVGRTPTTQPAAPPEQAAEAPPGAGPWQVVLEDCGADKFAAIRVVRTWTSCSLAEGKRIVEETPGVILETASPSVVVELTGELREAGAAFTVRSRGA